MKRILIFGLALICLAPQAHASKARLLALGQDADGSYFILDSRDVFLNPAAVNNFTPFADFELGQSAPATSVTQSSTPTTTTPNAEGGYYAGDSIKWGLQLGKIGMGTTVLQNANAYDTGTTTFVFPNNAAEILVGGNAAAFKWGAALLYGSATANSPADTTGAGNPQKSANSLALRGGLMRDIWDVHLNLNVLTSAKTQVSGTESYQYNHTLGASLGGSFKFYPQWTAFAQVDETPYKVDHTTSGTTVTNDDTDLGYKVGAARVMALEGKNFFYYSLALAGLNFKTNVNGTDTQKEQRLYLPIALGLEYGLAPWATVRASVTQNLILSTETQKNQPGSEVGNASTVNTTVANLGLGFTFQKFTIDTTLSGSTTGRFDSVNMLANLGATYVF